MKRLTPFDSARRAHRPGALLALLISFAPVLAVEVTIPPEAPGTVLFARDEIKRAASTATLPDIALEISGPGEAQSYRLAHEGAKWRVVGADAAGAMYGGLDLAEAIRLAALADLKPGEHRPFIAQRGIKFNIPLDLRTPSYSDNSDAAQANIPEVWSRAFWREYFDEMARYRFNVLSLWNLNPFPSIVKVPEYPDVALNDVLRGRREVFDDRFSHEGKDSFKPGFLQDAEVVRRMRMDEKIAFWREVLRMAKHRGVDVYWFTWNAFLFTEEGKHGIQRAKPDGEMLRYFRASVRETVKTYPVLAGMGITAGENMGSRLGAMGKEEWLWQAYGEGIRDALKAQPDRQFRLIHRFHMTGLDPVEVLERLSRPVRFQLQIRRGAHVWHDEPAVHPAAAARAFPQPPHLAHRTQRRHLQFPLGRSAVRLDGELYEVSLSLRALKIQLRLDPWKRTRIEVWYQGKFVGLAARRPCISTRIMKASKLMTDDPQLAQALRQ